ncbi:MAG TPA: ribosome small subunit-dependent GTPase A [Polyangiaceae bacterium]
MSALHGAGMSELRARLPSGTTGVLLGSSGVGKSSLTSGLLGRELSVALEIRTGEIPDWDARGRHTTTHRELFQLPGAGLLVDTPGLRELGLWHDAGHDTDRSGFSEIEVLAADCRFGDCRHEGEPGCAVRAAIEAGTLSEQRLQSARKLGREMERQRALGDAYLLHEQRRRQRAFGRRVREAARARRRG